MMFVPADSMTVNGRPLNKGRPVDAAARFWRSLDEWAGNDAPFEWGEFARNADQPPSGITRRRFVQLMGASLALAGLHGCTRQPEEKIVPYVDMPERMTPGVPLHYATAITLSGYGRGAIVTCREGRPIKVEGNPRHPDSLGATCVFDQAAVLSLYDPDRSRAVRHHNEVRSWPQFQNAWQAHLAERSSEKRIAIVTGNFTSPTLIAQMHALLDRLPQARWFVHEPTLRTAPSLPVPVYQLEQAKVIVALDHDLLHTGPGSVRYAMDFANRRRVLEGETQMNRSYVAEPMPSVTGAKADMRLRIRPSRIRTLVAALRGGRADLTPAESHWIDLARHDLEAHRGNCIVVLGPWHAEELQRDVMTLNTELGAVGNTVRYVQPFDAAADKRAEPFEALADDRKRFDTLIAFDCNPVYTASPDLRARELLEQMQLAVHFGLYEDETARLCDWRLPATHEFESWSDTRAFDGTTTIVQPLIAPLYAGRTAHELLALLARPELVPSSAHEIIRQAWRERRGAEDFELWWRQTLHAGVAPDTQAPIATVHSGSSAEAVGSTTEARAEAVPLELNITPDPRVWDGRFANNAWLQELPHPITKLTWDNAALLSPATAARLGLENELVIELAIGEQRVRAPVWIVPGAADDVVTVTLGYGRVAAGETGNGTGFDAFTLRRRDAPWHGSVKFRKLDDHYPLATTQQHQRMEGRPLQRTATLDEFRRNPHETAGPHPDAPAHSLMPGYDYSDVYKWGMAIDLTTCIGCGVCTIACQAENNIPVVGKEEIIRGREMHWIRVDRYYTGSPAEPGIRHQPVPCMHCEHAPCEVVCPTGATLHTTEGLNAMIYNRCIGTRYCSNNCPYKVRRFNFFDYVKEREQPNVLRLGRNPEVTVRSRGVMEKCTYCVQRIETARIAARKAGRRIGGDEVVPACAAACPTRSIIFGDLNQDSAVKKMHEQPHSYAMLAELNTRPRTLYLTEIRNPPKPQSAPDA